MTPIITPEELARLAAPFPLAVHSMREGNKVRGGKGIQWFTYMDKSEVENRLTEVFGGEWGTTVPVITPLGNGVAASIGIVIRGIMRGDTGEDSGKGSEQAKGATTDAFRRAGAKWGIAKYLYDMDTPIYTDTYPDGDWDAKRAREQEALRKFTEWYNKRFSNITQLGQQRSSQQSLQGNGQQERRIPPQTAQNGVNGSNSPSTVNDSGNAAPNAPSPAVASNSTGLWQFDLPALMAHPDLTKAYPQYTHRANAINLVHDGGYLANVANLSEAVKVMLARPDKATA